MKSGREDGEVSDGDLCLVLSTLKIILHSIITSLILLFGHENLLYFFIKYKEKRFKGFSMC